MHLLLTDETNLEPDGDRKFFVYGGLFFPIERLEDLDRGVTDVRERHGYSPDDVLKFSTNARPDHVSHEEATEAKREVVSLCQDLGCRFIAYVIHHNIATGRENLILRAANHVVGRFHRFLMKASDLGICVVDNLPVDRGFQYLEEKFRRGLDRHIGGYAPVDRIKLFAATTGGASHASSAMDIVLGTFRYCVNNPDRTEVTPQMFESVTRLMWGVDVRGTKHVR